MLHTPDVWPRAETLPQRCHPAMSTPHPMGCACGYFHGHPQHFQLQSKALCVRLCADTQAEMGPAAVCSCHQSPMVLGTAQTPRQGQSLCWHFLQQEHTVAPKHALCPVSQPLLKILNNTHLQETAQCSGSRANRGTSAAPKGGVQSIPKFRFVDLQATPFSGAEPPFGGTLSGALMLVSGCLNPLAGPSCCDAVDGAA